MFAAIINTLNSQIFAVACAKPKFLGIFEPWYQYLDVQKQVIHDKSGDSFTTCAVQNFHLLGGNSSFLLVALAILDDLVRLAGLVAVGFVIYGGIQYVTSQGSPNETSKAQGTIINALVGVVLAMLATGLVSFIGHKLGG